MQLLGKGQGLVSEDILGLHVELIGLPMLEPV